MGVCDNEKAIDEYSSWKGERMRRLIQVKDRLTVAIRAIDVNGQAQFKGGYRVNGCI